MVDLLLHTGRIARGDHRGADRRRARALCARTSTARRPRRSSPTCSTRSSVEGQAEPRLFGAGARDARRDGDAPTSTRCSRSSVAFLVKALAMHGYRPAARGVRVRARASAGDGRVVLARGRRRRCAPRAARSTPARCRFGAEGRAWLARCWRRTMAEVAGAGHACRRPSRDCFGCCARSSPYHVPARLKALDYLRAWLRCG